MKTRILNFGMGLMITLFAIINLNATKTMACQAGFTWAQTANNVITFTNTSTGTTNTTGYLWYFGYVGSTYVANPVFTFNVPGTYYVTLNFYDSFNNCNDTYSDSVTVTGVLICNLTLQGVGINTTCSTCNDGKAAAMTTGGTYPYTYLWSPTNGTTSQITSLNAGIYNVTVTDINNCTATTSATVGDTCLANSNFTWTQTANNTITFTNQGTGRMYWDFGDDPYHGLWDTTSPTHFYNIPGSYTACCYTTDYNTNFCQSSVCHNIVVTGSVVCNMTLSPSYAWATCSTCANGGVYTYVTGGTSPYHYLWSNAQTTNYQSNLLPGTYTVTVTDAHNCTATISETIGVCNVAPHFTWTQTSNNQISFSGTPTSNINSYGWNFGTYNGTGDGTVQNPVFNYNLPGTYYVCFYVTTDTGCSAQFCDSVTVTGVNCNHLSGQVMVNNASCHGCPTGLAYIEVFGGNAPFTYSWSPSGGTNITASNLLPGNYTCNIVDALGCHTSPHRFLGPDSSSCNAYFTLHPDTNTLHTYWAINYSTGVQPLHYHWYWGDTTNSPIDTLAYPTHTYAHPGLFTIYLMITDSTGCTSYFTYYSYYLARTANYMVNINVLPPIATSTLDKLTDNSFSIYPNPASTTLTIHRSSQSTNSPNQQLTITDVLGRIVYAQPINQSTNTTESTNTTIDISKLNNGIYFWQVLSNETAVAQGKVVLIK